MTEYCGYCDGELCGHGRCERCDGPCPHHSGYDGPERNDGAEIYYDED